MEWILLAQFIEAESFEDINGNGIYDAPLSANLDAFPSYQATGEPFTDSNNNGVWNDAWTAVYEGVAATMTEDERYEARIALFTGSN